MSLTVAAQPSRNATLHGRITTAGGQPVPLATVALLNKDKKIVAHTVCREEGSFVLHAPEAGDYVLQVSSVGYERGSFALAVHGGEQDLGAFTLTEGIGIEEILVKGRPMISSQVDRIIYDVTQDTTAATSTAQQIIEKLPFVTIDHKTNRIKVMGEENFVITVNGKKNLFLSEANQYVATLLQGDKMKQIELVTAPEGKYQDKMAVINIVTNGDLPNGFAGELNYEGGKDFSRETVGFTSKINRFIYNVSYQHMYHYTESLSNSTTVNYLADNDKTLTERFSKYTMNNHTLRFNSSYDISERDLLTLSGSYLNRGENSSNKGRTNIYDISETVKQMYFLSSKDGLSGDAFTASLNYQLSSRERPGRLFTATYNFERNVNDNDYDQTITGEVGYDDRRQLSTNRYNLSEHTVGADFSNALGTKHNYFVTARLVARRYDSDTRYDPPAATDNDLKYRQYVPALRASWSYLTPKVMLTAEANIENTMNRMRFGEGAAEVDKNFFEVRPRVTALYMISPASRIIFNYMIPSFRPDITLLNPYVDDSDPSHLKVGNPNLKPESTHTFTLAYTFFKPRINLNFTASYRHSGNAIYSYDYTSEEGVLTTTWGNIAKSDVVMFNANFRYEKPKVFEVRATGKATYSNYSYSGNEFPLWAFEGNIGTSVYFLKKAYVGIALWTGPLSTAVQSTRYHYYFGYNIYMGYVFSPRFRVYIYGERFIKKYGITKDEKQTDSFYHYNRTRWKSRNIGIDIQYSFGRLDGSVKQGRRAIKNEDRQKQE